MWSKRNRIIGLTALALAAGAGGYTLYDSVDADALGDLDAESFTHLRNEFNQAAGDVRVVVLLSPT